MNFEEVSRVKIHKQPPLILGVQSLLGLAVLASIPIFGAWRLLWIFVTLLPMTVVCDMMKRIYWRGFDPFIWRASQTGHFGRTMFWNILTHVLDWFVNAAYMTVGAYFIFKLAGGTSLPPVIAWCALGICTYPPMPFNSQPPSFKTNLYAMMQVLVPLAFVLVSMVHPLSPLAMAAVSFGLLPLLVAIRTFQELPRNRQDYEELMRDSERGIVRTQTWDRSWFPRPGVVFEPQFNKYDGVKASVFEEFRPALTILRINWCGMFLALALMVFGIVRVAMLGHSLLILFAPLVIVFGLFYGVLVSDVDRKMPVADRSMRCVFPLFAMSALAVPTVYFGGGDVQMLVAVGSLFIGYWFFFFGFVVRGTSRGVFDTAEFLATVAALATVVGVRVFFKCVWWESVLPVISFAIGYAYYRRLFPRKDLPEKGYDDAKVSTASIEDKAATAAKKDRRDRKRERQMAAFRRSKRG